MPNVTFLSQSHPLLCNLYFYNAFSDKEMEISLELKKKLIVKCHNFVLCCKIPLSNIFYLTLLLVYFYQSPCTE